MALKNKGLGTLSLIIVAFILMAGVAGVYIVKNIDKQDTPENIDDIVASLSEEAQEVFKDQHGIIKSATSVGKNQWVLAVDLVTRNFEWLPGNNKEPFYINQNPKIRNFNVTNETKAYHLCSGPEGEPVNIEVFMQNLQKTMERNLEVARIFDITGHDIVNIYSSCVP